METEWEPLSITKHLYDTNEIRNHVDTIKNLGKARFNPNGQKSSSGGTNALGCLTIAYNAMADVSGEYLRILGNQIRCPQFEKNPEIAIYCYELAVSIHFIMRERLWKSTTPEFVDLAKTYLDGTKHFYAKGLSVAKDKFSPGHSARLSLILSYAKSIGVDKPKFAGDILKRAIITIHSGDYSDLGLSEKSVEVIENMKEISKQFAGEDPDITVCVSIIQSQFRYFT